MALEKSTTKREKLFGKKSPNTKDLIYMTSWELNKILGDFEKVYNSYATGMIVNNSMLGPVRAGTVEHALSFGAITKKNIGDKEIYFIKLPEYNNYLIKVAALRELCRRREDAKKKGEDENESKPTGLMSKISDKLAGGRKIDKWSATQIVRVLNSVGISGSFDEKGIRYQLGELV